MINRIGLVCLTAAVICTACQLPGGQPAAPAEALPPIQELIQAGRAPVEVELKAPSGIGGVMVGALRVIIRNLSDAPIKSVSWTLVALDADGRVLPDGVSESGYAEWEPIGPGERIEGSLLPGPSDAASHRLILRQVLYERTVSGYAMVMKWDNPGHDAELASLTGP